MLRTGALRLTAAPRPIIRPAQSGGKVAILEKESYPRDKYCGDAVCTPAIRILQEMGVMQARNLNLSAHGPPAARWRQLAPVAHLFFGARPGLWALTGAPARRSSSTTMRPTSLTPVAS